MFALNRNTGVWVLLKTLFRQYPWRMTITALVMTLSSFIQGMGIALLAPLLSMIGFQGPTTTGRMAKLITAILHTVGLPMTVGTVLLLFLALVIFENALKYFESSFSQDFIIRFVERLRNDLFEAYLRADWPYWLQKRLGHMAGRLTEENVRVEGVLSTLMVFLSNLVLMAVLLGVAFVFSWPMALIFLAAGGLLVLVMETPLFRKGSRSNISSQASAVQEVVHEHLNAAKLIKSSGLVDQSLTVFKDAVRQLHEIEYRQWRQAYKTSAIFNPLMISILCLGFYCAVGPLHIPQSKAIVILFIYFRLAARLSGTRDMGHGILLSAPFYAAILQDMREAAQHVEQTASKTPSAPISLSQHIEFRDMSYAYHPGTPVLEHIALTIAANKTTAIVGESGSGKSTLLDLVVGLLTPNAGQVLVDGKPLQALDLNAWREKIGYVSQDTILFNDTVTQNIRWANAQASDDDIDKAARMAQAHDFISALPAGYKTTIGNRGTRLSGGERQRIALARALIRQPQLLVLDEATSALDSISEKLIQNAIDQLQNRMTIVIVTHRLSTIRSADVIYVLDHGRLVEEGNWDKLTQASGSFHRIWQTQEHKGT